MPRSPPTPIAALFCATVRLSKTQCRGRPDMNTTQKPSLTWASAAKIAWRELQASRAKFLFVIVSVAIGVAALTGVRGFSDSFQKTLLGEARTIMAADISARMFRQPTPQEEQQLNVLASRGIQRTEVSETVSMVSSPA